MAKYVPPHKRNQLNEETRECKSIGKKYAENRKISKVRDDFFQRPIFNVKTTQTKPNIPRQNIEYVDIVLNPVLVMPPIPHEESPYKRAIQTGLELDINKFKI
jgi:hypothetical protein